MGDQVSHHVPGHVGGDGETDADVAPARRQDGGVEPHQLPAQVHQGPAGIAGVDGGVGLDEVLVALDAEAAAAERADDPRGHRLTEPEGVADGDDEVPDPKPVGVREGQCREILGRHLDHCDVGLRVRADQPPLQSPTVLQRDGDLLGVVHHVVVGEHVPPPGVDDDPGAETLAAALLGPLGHVEEAAEERVGEQGAALGAHGAPGRNVDDGRGDALQHGGETRQPFPVHHRGQGAQDGSGAARHGKRQHHGGEPPTPPRPDLPHTRQTPLSTWIRRARYRLCLGRVTCRTPAR